MIEVENKKVRDEVTLRGVYGKEKEYSISPVRMKNGLYPRFVKKVKISSSGESEMILSDAEIQSEESQYFIPSDTLIEAKDGTTFDLTNSLEKNKWEAIKDSYLIVPERDALDEDGNLMIDGNKQRYGMAELWIERPGAESEVKVTKRKIILQACNFISQDTSSGRATKVKLLGKSSRNMPDSDIEDYLYQRAEKDPKSITDLYTGSDTQLRLLLIDAKENRVIRLVNGVYVYGDNSLGVTEQAVINYFKTPSNRQIFESIRNETYPNNVNMAIIAEAAAAKIISESLSIEKAVDYSRIAKPMKK